MFQTINHKSGGFVQITTVGNKSTIKAWSHGTLLGDHYKTVSGALGAITRAHKEWVADFERESRRFRECLVYY